jgi:hypothetical protein
MSYRLLGWWIVPLFEGMHQGRIMLSGSPQRQRACHPVLIGPARVMAERKHVALKQRQAVRPRPSVMQ